MCEPCCALLACNVGRYCFPLYRNKFYLFDIYCFANIMRTCKKHAFKLIVFIYKGVE